MRQLSKRSIDQLVVALDFAAPVLNAGETLVASNARGTLDLIITDAAGVDVTAALSEGEPWIVAGTQVAFWLRGGAFGPYYQVEVRAPTSDGEILSARVPLEVLP